MHFWLACKLPVPMQHYVPSLLALKGLEDETDCSGSMTYVHWWGDGEHMQPETFNLWEVSGDLVEQMRSGSLDFIIVSRPSMKCQHEIT